MDQLAECLPRQPVAQDSSLAPHTLGPSSWKVKAGELKDQGHSLVHEEFKSLRPAYIRHCPKSKK